VRKKYLGDSFDIVKRFWAECLGVVAPLLAHPRFIPAEIRREFETVVGMRVLDPNELPTQPFGLFLDPDTGIPLPTAKLSTATKSHAPLLFIEAEFARLKPRYLICFDQSHDRACKLPKPDQRKRKRADLRTRNLSSFYYVSHAPFLFVATDRAVLDSLRHRLIQSGIPKWRFECEDALPSNEMGHLTRGRSRPAREQFVTAGPVGAGPLKRTSLVS
jgi:hypothetical protein